MGQLQDLDIFLRFAKLMVHNRPANSTVSDYTYVCLQEPIFSLSLVSLGGFLLLARQKLRIVVLGIEIYERESLTLFIRYDES